MKTDHGLVDPRLLPVLFQRRKISCMQTQPVKSGHIHVAVRLLHHEPFSLLHQRKILLPVRTGHFRRPLRLRIPPLHGPVVKVYRLSYPCRGQNPCCRNDVFQCSHRYIIFFLYGFMLLNVFAFCFLRFLLYTLSALLYALKCFCSYFLFFLFSFSTTFLATVFTTVSTILSAAFFARLFSCAAFFISMISFSRSAFSILPSTRSFCSVKAATGSIVPSAMANNTSGAQMNIASLS